jgi:hypothetical protein
MNNIRLIVLAIGLVIIPGVILYGSSNNNDSSIAVLNGEQISIKLLRHFVQKNRASVINQFAQKYKVTDYSDFWYSSYGDKQVPAEILKNNSLQDCIKTTVQLILAKKKGVIKDISYEGFLTKLRESNISRRQAVIEKKTIYGPVEFNEFTYYDYLFSLTVLELKKHLTGNELDTTEKNLKDYYEKNKQKMYVKKGSLISYPFENVYTNVRSDYIDYQYDNLINEITKTAKIKVNNALYNKIRIE